MTESDAFLDQIMRAIVTQFFESPEIRVPMEGGAYIPPRSTPAQVVTARLLSDKQGELLDKIMEKIDLDIVAEGVAKAVLAVLTKPEPTTSYSYRQDAGVQARKNLKERVDNRLVELLAADLFAKMKQEEV